MDMLGSAPDRLLDIADDLVACLMLVMVAVAEIEPEHVSPGLHMRVSLPDWSLPALKSLRSSPGTVAA
jgi:hypothetical protein